jgi:hypothetical protein
MTIRNLITKFIRDEDGFLGALAGIIGGVSSIFGGNKTQKAAQGAANQGFDYLKGNESVGQAQQQGLQAGVNQQSNLGIMGGLLGLGGDPAQGQAAFDQYQQSTGYQFRVDQGMAGIEGSRAARGVLNSGASAKALQDYGQGMASQEFGNYMDQVSRQTGMEGQVADRGLNAALGVGQAGSSAGQGSAAAIQQGESDRQSGLGGLISGVSSLFGF